MTRHRRRGSDEAGDATDALLVAAGQGDTEAFAAFYDRTATTVFGMLSAALGDAAGAERSTKEAYLRLWHRAPEFDPAGRSARATLLLVARRVLAARLVDAYSGRPTDAEGGRGGPCVG